MVPSALEVMVLIQPWLSSPMSPFTRIIRSESRSKSRVML